MRRQLVIVMALIILAADQVAAYDLSQHQWRHRLLFLVAPESDDPDLSAQRRDIEQRRDAMLDRDLLLFLLLPEHGFVGDQALPARTVAKLRAQLGVTPEDRLLILIGKDGGEKTTRRAAHRSARYFSADRRHADATRRGARQERRRHGQVSMKS